MFHKLILQSGGAFLASSSDPENLVLHLDASPLFPTSNNDRIMLNGEIPETQHPELFGNDCGSTEEDYSTGGCGLIILKNKSTNPDLAIICQ